MPENNNRIESYGSDPARICRGMGNPIRFRILKMLSEGVCNVNDMVTRLGQEQSKVSKHLAVLLDVGLVGFSVQGRKHCYDLVRPEIIRDLLFLFEKLDDDESPEIE